MTGAETSPSIAKIYIQNDGVKPALEIYIGDLKATNDLLTEIL